MLKDPFKGTFLIIDISKYTSLWQASAGPTPGLEVQALQKRLPDPTVPPQGNVYLGGDRPVARPATSRTAIPTQLEKSGDAPAVKSTRPCSTTERVKRLTAPTPSRSPTLFYEKPLVRSLQNDLETVASSPNDGSSLVFPNDGEPKGTKPLVEMTPVPSPSTPLTRKEPGGNI